MASGPTVLLHMDLDAGCEMTVDTMEESAIVLMLQPQTGDGQSVRQSEIDIQAGIPFRDFNDAFGNLCRRVCLPQGRSIIRATCRVEAPDYIDVDPQASFTLIQDLPDEALQFLLPSRYCESDLLLPLAYKITRKAQPGYQQAEAIRKWIFKRIRYKYGVSNSSTSAKDTAKKKAGVCRDFSHLGIALCRAIRLPARMVVGYLHLLDPMDLHAWFEAYIGGRWYTFDATQGTPKGNRIVVAYGRDAADVAQLTEYGPLQTVEMKVWVSPHASN